MSIKSWIRSLILLTFFGFIIAGCGSGGGGCGGDDFRGTYQGDDTGTFEICVEDGFIEGELSSNNAGEDFDIDGSVDASGNVAIGVSNTGASFSGTLTGETIQGTWVNNQDGINGTFQGRRV